MICKVGPWDNAFLKMLNFNYISILLLPSTIDNIRGVWRFFHVNPVFAFNNYCASNRHMMHLFVACAFTTAAMPHLIGLFVSYLLFCRTIHLFRPILLFIFFYGKALSSFLLTEHCFLYLAQKWVCIAHRGPDPTTMMFWANDRLITYFLRKVYSTLTHTVTIF